VSNHPTRGWTQDGVVAIRLGQPLCFRNPLVSAQEPLSASQPGPLEP
jgi:hypothetical protein